MTEAEWLTGAETGLMLEHLRHRVCQRKILLFAAAHVADLHRQAPDLGLGTLAAAARGYAKGQGTYAAVEEASAPLKNSEHDSPGDRALHFLGWAFGFPGVVYSFGDWAFDGNPWSGDRSAAALLRCVAGNPFQRPVFDAGWLTANGAPAQRFAEVIQSADDFASLPVLADALEEAGCTEPAVLAHCRGPGPHAPGCWALELLLCRPQPRRSLAETQTHLGYALRVPETMPHPTGGRGTRDYYKCGLANADYSNLTLPRVFFGRSFVERVNYRNTDLSQSWMCWNDFVDCDLSGADLSGCEMRSSIFRRCRFVGANLAGADLRRSSFEGCDFTGAVLRGTRADEGYADEYELTERLSVEQLEAMEWHEDPGPEPPGG
jgi:hypothetical protein